MNKRKTGSQYEEYAIAFMKSLGYTLLEQNFRCTYGEIDAIFLSENNEVVFCEIKYRSSDEFGDPLEAVDYRKQRRICKTALYYIKKKQWNLEKAYRFDVIGIYRDKKVYHVKNAFDFIG